MGLEMQKQMGAINAMRANAIKDFEGKRLPCWWELSLSKGLLYLFKGHTQTNSDGQEQRE